jgi:hypothetical protein
VSSDHITDKLAACCGQGRLLGTRWAPTCGYSPIGIRGTVRTIRSMGKMSTRAGAKQGDPGHDADLLAWFEACRIAVRTIIESEAWVSRDQLAAGCA